MPSHFISGKPAQQKTLAELVRKMMEGRSDPRPSFATTPAKVREVKASSSNKETEEQRRKRLVKKALKELKPDADSSR